MIDKNILTLFINTWHCNDIHYDVNSDEVQNLKLSGTISISHYIAYSINMIDIINFD